MNTAKCVLLLLTVFVTSACCLRCYQCPDYERRDAAKCLKHTEECQRDLSCFFEYRGKWLNLGCGKRWEKPTGCHAGKCIHWCDRNLCNKQLLRKAPFDIPGVEQDDRDNGFIGWFSNSTPRLACHVLTAVWVVVISLLMSI